MSVVFVRIVMGNFVLLEIIVVVIDNLNMIVVFSV